MLAYEDARTESIVKRLATITKIATVVITLGCLVIFGIIVGGAATATNAEFGAGAIFGAILGLIIASTLSSLCTVVMEWMAQLLVTQASILDAVKKSGQAT